MSKHIREERINPVISTTIKAATQALDRIGEERMAVLVLAFDYGEGGRMFYGASAQRDDACAALVEFLGIMNPEMLQQAVERWKNQGLLGAGSEVAQ